MESNIAQRNDGQPRVYHVVCKLHAMVTEIWKGRNEELHSRDQENAVLQRTAMDAEIARSTLCTKRASRS
jgi:hypothetical protein